MKVEWRYVMREFGAQYVPTIGKMTMQRWPVSSLDTLPLVKGAIVHVQLHSVLYNRCYCIKTVWSKC